MRVPAKPRAAVIAALFLWGCDSEPGGGDAGSKFFFEDAGTPVSIEIGTGVFEFEPLSDGDSVPIIKGGQGGGRNGGFHVWHALRANGIDPREVEIYFTTLLAGSREVIASSSIAADLGYVDGAYQFLGSAPFIVDCCLVENAELVMKARIQDRTGAGGSDSRRVRTSGACVYGDPPVDACP